jgi:hypothetical protein
VPSSLKVYFTFTDQVGSDIFWTILLNHYVNHTPVFYHGTEEKGVYCMTQYDQMQSIHSLSAQSIAQAYLLHTLTLFL